MVEKFNKETVFVLNRFSGNAQEWYQTTRTKLKKLKLDNQLNREDLIIYPLEIAEVKKTVEIETSYKIKLKTS